MIARQHKCIFVEIPKTESTSIRDIIGAPPKAHLNICEIRRDMLNHWTQYGDWKNKLLAALYELRSEESRREAGQQQFNSYFKFAFVRNPWDRVVSLYLRQQGLQMRDQMSFGEFVDWIKYSSSTCVHPSPHTNQLDWLVDGSGNLLVDFIGRFENLASDWSAIALRLGLPAELPHANSNEFFTRPYTEYYTGKTQEIVGRKFCVDIEYFQYQFGN